MAQLPASPLSRPLEEASSIPLLQPARPVAAGLLGALSGSALAIADFGAEWLWLDRPVERLGLLLGLLRLHILAGALAAYALYYAWSLADRLIRRPPFCTATSRTTAPLTLSAALAPALGYVGSYLTDRPAVAALPFAPFSVWAVLLFCFCASLLIFSITQKWLRRNPLSTAGAAGLLHLAGIGVGKLDQRYLPGYYEALHGALTALAFVLHAAGFAVLWRAAPYHALRLRWRQRLPPRLAPVIWGSALMGLLLSTHALSDRYQNVRVAITHPRASHSHSLALALAPVLGGLDRLVVLAQHQRATDAQHHARTLRPASNPRAAPTWPLAHVLVVTIDALRADHLGCYGYPRSTSPHLDRFAEQAVRFEHAYTTAPHSSHALASLWTSQHLLERVRAGGSLPLQTLPMLLTKAGYHTAAFFIDGVFYSDRSAYRDYAERRLDFNRYDQTPREAEALTDAALEEMTRTAARGEPSSLFWVHYFDVHAPYRSTRFGRRDVDRYDSEIARVDAAFARLLSGARARLAGPLIVIVTADHGEAFGEHGHAYHGSSLYDEQVRIPLLIAAPGLPSAQLQDAASLLDVAPTILGALGLPVPDSFAGRDLLAAAAKGRAVLSSVGHQRAVVRYPYKLIVQPRWSTLELYNIQDDPRERANLADRRPGLANYLKRLTAAQGAF